MYVVRTQHMKLDITLNISLTGGLIVLYSGEGYTWGNDVSVLREDTPTCPFIYKNNNNKKKSEL